MGISWSACSSIVKVILHKKPKISISLLFVTKIKNFVLGKTQEDISSSNSSNLIGFDFSDLYKLQEFINQLTLEQSLAFSFFTGTVVILLTMISISSALWGNFLVDYFKIEERFPFLSTYLKYRSKLRSYFLIVNII